MTCPYVDASAVPKPTTIAARAAHLRRANTMTTAITIATASAPPPSMTSIVAADIPRRTWSMACVPNPTAAATADQRRKCSAPTPALGLVLLARVLIGVAAFRPDEALSGSHRLPVAARRAGKTVARPESRRAGHPGMPRVIGPRDPWGRTDPRHPTAAPLAWRIA